MCSAERPIRVNVIECKHPCRWRYHLLIEEKHSNEFIPVFEDERGAYLMNTKRVGPVSIFAGSSRHGRYVL